MIGLRHASTVYSSDRNILEVCLPHEPGSGRGGPTQVNGIFDRSMESARFKFGAARLAAERYAEEKSEKSEPSEMCGRDPPCRGRNKKQYQ